MTDNTILDALECRGDPTKRNLTNAIKIYKAEREVVEAAIAWEEQNGDELELTFNLEDAVRNLKELKHDR